MRDIIFKGKRIGTDVWEYGSLITNNNTHSYIMTDYNDFRRLIEVNTESVGQMTDSNDVDGNPIFEGDLVSQRAVLVGDNDNLAFSGTVRFTEGQWLIDNGEAAIPLWTEHRENKIIEW